MSYKMPINDLLEEKWEMQLCVSLCHYLSTSCYFGKDFCDGSPGAPLSAPKDGPKGLLRLRVPPALWLKYKGESNHGNDN
jgi:hypothetical protein